MSEHSTAATEGLRSLQAGEVEAATRHFEEGLQEDPQDPGCLLGMMRLQSLARDLDSAAELAERLLAVSPGHPEARSHVALCRLQEGDARALAELKLLAGAANAGPYERLNHARALSSLGQAQQAEETFAAACALEPQNPLPYQEAADAALDREDAPAAVRWLTEATGVAPDQRGLWIGLSEAYEAAGDPLRALHALDRALALEPGDLPLLEHRYDMATRAEDWAQAAQTARTLVAQAPAEHQYVFQLAEALTFAGQLDQAQKVLERLALLDATAPEPLRALAEVFLARGDRERALSTLQRAVSVAPDEPGVANDLASLYLDEPESLPRAAGLLRPILEAHPEDALTAFNLALALSRDEPQEALRCARIAARSGQPELAAEAEALVAALSAKAGK